MIYLLKIVERERFHLLLEPGFMKSLVNLVTPLDILEGA